MSRAPVPGPLAPSLYRLTTRVGLTELSRVLGRPVTLGDVPDAELDRVEPNSCHAARISHATVGLSHVQEARCEGETVSLPIHRVCTQRAPNFGMQPTRFARG
jgi:hypothetical protein